MNKLVLVVSVLLLAGCASRQGAYYQPVYYPAAYQQEDAYVHQPSQLDWPAVTQSPQPYQQQPVDYQQPVYQQPAQLSPNGSYFGGPDHTTPGFFGGTRISDPPPVIYQQPVDSDNEQDNAGTATKSKYLGNLGGNQYNPNSTSNPYGAGNPYSADSVKNPYGQYGNPYSPKSVDNPYATDTPKLYDSQGNYRGKLSNNPYDPDSISNPYGRYGNPYSPDSINNPYGAGNPYAPDSPKNPYGTGWSIIDK
jgi:hypothetical protein